MDLAPDHRYHLATVDALRHASDRAGLPIEVRIVGTDTIRDADEIAKPGYGVIIGPGSPYLDQEAAHAVVRRARERGIPLVGT